MTDNVYRLNSLQAIDQHFRSALHNITRDPRFNDADLLHVFHYITETAAEVLDCDRVSIWEYHDDEDSGRDISRLLTYDIKTGHSLAPFVIREAESPHYFASLEADSLLVINDAARDPRCQVLRGSLSSFVDAPFLENGRLAGTICVEQVGSTRTWNTSEQNFCANMANLITIAIERDRRKQTEKYLRQEEDRYRTLIEHLALGFVILVEDRIVYANRVAAELTHLNKPQALEGSRITDVLKVEERSALDSWLRSSSRDGPMHSAEHRVKLWDDSTLTLETTASPATWNGQPAIQVIFRDNSDIAFARERLKRSERLLSQAQRIANLGSWVWDVASNTTECSLGLRRILGLRKNPIDNRISVFAHPEDAEQLEQVLHAAVHDRESYEITYRINTHSGERWIEETGIPELGRNQEVVRIHAVSRDITRQVMAEKRIRATEGRFRNLGNSFTGGFFHCDLSGRILAINNRLGQWYGIRRRDFIGKPLAALLGQQVFSEIEHHVEKALSGSGATFELEAGFRHENIEIVQFTLAPDIDTSGRLHGFFGLVTDISETRAVERALRQAQKMEAMGQLTGGIAHDFNNILAVIMGNLELALGASNGADQRPYLLAALQGAERGASITQKLLGFARSGSKGTEDVRLDHLVQNTGDMIRQSLGSSISLSLDSDENLWETNIDANDCQDALLNLCINARDAMPQGGRLDVTLENRTLDETAQRIHPALKAGDYVLLSVTDTGLGMDASVRERLFEPFFTTKPEGKGTGLGMSMVFGFVTRSKGEILVYSAPGEGTTINIYLPRAAVQGFTAESSAQPPAKKAGERILIVDDEEMVARVAESILKELGYSTSVVTTTDAAIEMLMDGQNFDLLFSDVVMPKNLNGFELAQAARKIQPHIRVLLTSGFARFRSVAPPDDAAKELAASILQKPYSRRDLDVAIRRVLEN